MCVLTYSIVIEEKCLDFSETATDPAVIEIFENSHYNENQVMFQHRIRNSSWMIERLI